MKAGYIALVGRPNVGKSTLLNTILKSPLSVVTPKAQTTRNRILGIHTTDEVQIVFMDTPGIHQALEKSLNAFMIAETEEALVSPDLIWYLVDPHSSMKHEALVLEKLKRARKVPIFLILNKSDQYKVERLSRFQNELREALVERELNVKDEFQISALKNQGVDSLLEKSLPYIPEGERFYSDPDQMSDRPVKFFLSEMIRGRLFYCLGDELPYSCGVVVEEVQEDAKPYRIEAIIYVERDSQKAIVVGKGGSKIKEIGQTARQEIETFLGQKVFLGLRVKVSKDWTSRPELLRQLGYPLGKK